LFEPGEGVVYLDAATYGLPPRPTLDAIRQALSDWQHGTANWQDWDRHGDRARALFAEILGASSDSVALIPSASVGVGTAASRLSAGDEAVVADDEFRSVIYPVLVRQRDGVRVRVVAFDRLAESLTADTRLVAFSLIQSQSGRAAALTDILAAARGTGTEVLIDATHALPFVSVADEIGAIDYLVCAAYKHLLCPRGTGFLYVAPRHLNELVPANANWRTSRDPYGVYYGPPLDLPDAAARFDVSLAWFDWIGASASLKLIRQWQLGGELDAVKGLARDLATRLGQAPPRGSVVSLPLADVDRARAALAADGIRASVRAGAVRLSPHVYNTASDIERAVQAVAPYMPVGAAG
jgi:selenocysteine lyase/cysteine desulfurase